MSLRFTFAAGLGALALLAGCTSSSITNLTPQTVSRSPDGLYPIEARWDTGQRSIQGDSFTPYVVVGTQFYPMQRVATMTNHWEALLPVPADKRFVNYQFKFDYDHKGTGSSRGDSLRTPNYQLEITGK